MSNNYSQFSEVIDNITDKERAWLDKMPTGDFHDDIVLEDVQEFFDMGKDGLAVYGVDGGVYSRFPEFEMDFEEHDGNRQWWLHGDDNFNSDHVLLVVQTFLAKFRPKEVFKMTWCEYCDKPRIGEFGGAWLAISADDFLSGNTWGEADEAAEALLTGDQKL